MGINSSLTVIDAASRRAAQEPRPAVTKGSALLFDTFRNRLVERGGRALADR
jgi:hypothetical protein